MRFVSVRNPGWNSLTRPILSPSPRAFLGTRTIWRIHLVLGCLNQASLSQEKDPAEILDGHQNPSHPIPSGCLWSCKFKALFPAPLNSYDIDKMISFPNPVGLVGHDQRDFHNFWRLHYHSKNTHCKTNRLPNERKVMEKEGMNCVDPLLDAWTSTHHQPTKMIWNIFTVEYALLCSRFYVLVSIWRVKILSKNGELRRFENSPLKATIVGRLFSFPFKGPPGQFSGVNSLR